MVTQGAGVVPIDDGRAGEHGSHGVGFKRVAELMPANEIGADCVAPGHVAPFGAERIVLEKQVILAFIKDQAVGIVDPVFGGGEMKLGAVGFVIERLGGFGELFGIVGEGDLIDVDVAPAAGFVVDDLKSRGFILQLANIPGEG